MIALGPTARPALRRRARLRWDAARGTHVLLYPEGLLVLTPEAAEVLGLCDGARTVDDLVAALAARYPDAPEATLRTDVTDLLARLAARGFVGAEG